MPRIFSIGHSTRSIDEFVGLLRENDVAVLVDVRRFPGSKRNPHFGTGSLAATLSEAGVDYVHEPDLGGYRKPRPDSPHKAWQNDGFRAYADHMDTREFRAALDRLIQRASGRLAAIMCAEAVPWRCHRQLISDALTTRDWEVIHILGPGETSTHRLNPHARRLEDGRLIYAERHPEQNDLFGRVES